jgi:hypothetical protein
MSGSEWVYAGISEGEIQKRYAAIAEKQSADIFYR